MEHELLQFFTYEHLRPDLREISKPFGDTARELVGMTSEQLEAEADLIARSQAASVLTTLISTIDRATPPNVEATTSVVKIDQARRELVMKAACGHRPADIHDVVLRLLLEAKDCAVRALLFRQTTAKGPTP